MDHLLDSIITKAKVQIKINLWCISIVEDFVMEQLLQIPFNHAISEVSLGWDQLKNLSLKQILMVKAYYQPKKKRILYFMIGPKCLWFTVMAVNIKECVRNRFPTKMHSCISEGITTVWSNSISWTSILISTMEILSFWRVFLQVESQPIFTLTICLITPKQLRFIPFQTAASSSQITSAQSFNNH